MKKIVLGVCPSILSCALAAGQLAGCGGDDVNPVHGPVDASVDTGVDSPSESGPRDAGPDTTVGDDGGPDAAVDTGVDAPPPPPVVLLSMNNTASSELLVVDLTTNAKNSLVYPSAFGTTFSRGADPYALEQKTDIVARLDARKPWNVVSSWSVALADRADGGAAYSDPLAIAVAGTKGYVARYTRNRIAVIGDVTQVADAGAPAKAIDLSPLLQAKDTDGVVEATFAFAVPSRHMLYVLLGNIDRNLVAPDGYTLLCADTKALLVGIDTNTDQIVGLGGTGTQGSVVLAGYNPAFGVAGAAAVYDAANDRVLVLHAGCNAVLGDGGPGAVTKRVVEELKFGAGGQVTATTLLDVSTSGFPSAFAYIGPHDAVLGLGIEVRKWDPTTTTLGALVANAPDTNAFAYAGNGALVGIKTNYLADGGQSLDVVRTQLGDGGTQTLMTNPFKDNTGFIGGVEVWPPVGR